MDKELDRKAEEMLKLLGLHGDLSEEQMCAGLKRLVFDYLKYYLDSTCRSIKGVTPEHDYSCYVLQRSLELLKDRN